MDYKLSCFSSPEWVPVLFSMTLMLEAAEHQTSVFLKEILCLTLWAQFLLRCCDLINLSSVRKFNSHFSDFQLIDLFELIPNLEIFSIYSN